MTTIASMEADESCSRLRAEVKDLLPGIPDEITLDHITSKLPWQVFNILSSVSHAWLHAIGTHEVYNARVRSHSTETLFLMSNGSEETALFDLRKDSFHQLPSTLTLDGDIRKFGQRVTLDGKFYVLGGLVKSKSEQTFHCTNEVYVLDLAGQKKWKKCASMTESRAQFGCGVMNGKLYVFGGTSCLQPVLGSEVYDPKENKWSAIKPMMYLRFKHRVCIVGEELFVHGGLRANRNHFDSIKKRMMDTGDSDFKHTEYADSWEFYHPGKDEWREVKSYPRSFDSVFMASGKVHRMFADFRTRRDDMQTVVHDFDTNSWAHGDFFSFSETSKWPLFSVAAWPLSVLAVDDDVLVALVCWYAEDLDDEVDKYSLVHCKGFGSKDKNEIIWQVKEHFLSSAWRPVEMYRIQL